MQVILGAGGVIGRHIAGWLGEQHIPVRLAGRRLAPGKPGQEAVQADLLRPDDVERAVKGCSVAYLCAGIRYHSATWEKEWPAIMQNVLDACARAQCRLVFFDNVYAYGPAEGAMTEQTPEHPTSRKGRVRAKIAGMARGAHARGDVQTLVARAADFYGPDTPLAFTSQLIFERIAAGKSPQWFVDMHQLHSLAYTPDTGRAAALLGNTDDAYGRTWHLPTDKAVTGQEFMQRAIAAAGLNMSPQVFSKFMLRLVSLFIPPVRESMEMLYQFDRPYILDDAAFRARFPDFPITPLEEGILATLRHYRQQAST